jgi:hypothetical protein
VFSHFLSRFPLSAFRLLAFGPITIRTSSGAAQIVHLSSSTSRSKLFFEHGLNVDAYRQYDSQYGGFETHISCTMNS